MDDINEKIRADLIIERQKIIGFAASEAATNLLEYFLHRKSLIDPGFRVNHRYFSSARRAESYIDMDFPHKKKIIALLIKQEQCRDKLCYGKAKEKEAVTEAISTLIELKNIIENECGEEL